MSTVRPYSLQSDCTVNTFVSRCFSVVRLSRRNAHHARWDAAALYASCSCVARQLCLWSVDWAWRTNRTASSKYWSYSNVIFWWGWAKEEAHHWKPRTPDNLNNKLAILVSLFLLIFFLWGGWKLYAFFLSRFQKCVQNAGTYVDNWR